MGQFSVEIYAQPGSLLSGNQQSDDFQVVGAYPQGHSWDICTERPDDATNARIAMLADPRLDPVTGESGIRTVDVV